MSTFAESIKEFINVTGLSAKIKALEAELALLKQLESMISDRHVTSLEILIKAYPQ